MNTFDGLAEHEKKELAYYTRTHCMFLELRVTIWDSEYKSCPADSQNVRERIVGSLEYI